MNRDIKDSLSREESDKYSNLLTSLAHTAISQTEGITGEINVGKKNKKFGRSLESGNVHVYIGGNEVVVDVYVNVIFGYNVPQVACELQEKIINAIKENTPLTPKAVNINVSNAIFLSV